MINLLVVDDEEGILDVERIFLEKTGIFNVSCSSSALSAIEKLKTEEFDAVVSDYEMPGLNGIEFLKCVRKSGNNIPFIIFTGRSREDVVIEALNSGVDSYIQKGGDLKSQFAELTHRIVTSVEKKKAEKELLLANEYNKCLIEAHVDPLVTIDCRGLIDDVNNSMEQMASCNRENLIGKKFCDIFTNPDDVKKALSLVLDNEELNDYPLFLKTINGTSVPVLLFATLYHTGMSSRKGNSHVKGIFAELHYAEETPYTGDGRRDETDDSLWMTFVEHDIKNAICTGFGYCDILKDSGCILPDEMKYLKKAEGCFKRIERTLKSIECFRSIGKEETVLSPVSLDDLMEKELSCYTENTIIYEKCGKHIMADSLLGSVFENIFGNAVKYGSPDTEIIVRAKDLDKSICICIEDNSSGMPPEIMKKLSGGFYSENKPCGNEGLGLYIISSLVNRYSGSISAYERLSGRPESGTKILLTLPKAINQELINKERVCEASQNV